MKKGKQKLNLKYMNKTKTNYTNYTKLNTEIQICITHYDGY